MTKRRWLKSAIEQAKKTEVSMPWTRDAHRIDARIVAALASPKPTRGLQA